MILHPEDVRRIAHAAVLHYERLRKVEGVPLPPSEAALLRLAKQIECCCTLNGSKIESLKGQVS